MSHPYGAKPLASMAFLDISNLSLRKVRPDGLGILKCLRDESILELLGYVNAEDLCHMSIVSRCVYVFAMTSDLWRDLYLRRFNSKPIHFIKCWKDTYVLEHIDSLYKTKQQDGTLDEKRVPIHDRNRYIHHPIKVNGMFSDLLHRLWACHTFDLSSLCPGIFKHSDKISIPRIDYNSTSVDDFIQNYELLNRPVVITNACNNWMALTKWTNEFLIQECQNARFRATSATAPEAASFTMDEYVQYMSQVKEEVPLYLFERDFLKKVPALGTNII